MEMGCTAAKAASSAFCQPGVASYPPSGESASKCFGSQVRTSSRIVCGLPDEHPRVPEKTPRFDILPGRLQVRLFFELLQFEMLDPAVLEHGRAGFEIAIRGGRVSGFDPEGVESIVLSNLPGSRNQVFLEELPRLDQVVGRERKDNAVAETLAHENGSQRHGSCRVAADGLADDISFRQLRELFPGERNVGGIREHQGPIGRNQSPQPVKAHLQEASPAEEVDELLGLLPGC